MIIDVEADGLKIPRAWLSGAVRVELLREDGRIVIVPIDGQGNNMPGQSSEERNLDIFDPIDGLGANPMDLGVSDASVNLDEYVYGDPHRLES